MVLKFIIKRLITKFKQVGKRLYGAKITVMGLAYKKNINDPRESPAIKSIEELANLGARVRVYDPLTPLVRAKAGAFISAGKLSMIQSKLV